VGKGLDLGATYWLNGHWCGGLLGPIWRVAGVCSAAEIPAIILENMMNAHATKLKARTAGGRVVLGMILPFLITLPLFTPANAAADGSTAAVAVSTRTRSVRHRARDAGHASHEAVPHDACPLIATGLAWSDASGDWRQVGMASWYGGKRWQGKMTASGARYDDSALTAAHATPPIGSRVRVTVQTTGRSVIVTINDRPRSQRRIIDLSRGAAHELGILGRGMAVVSLTLGWTNRQMNTAGGGTG
jgi:hypothetical protein